MTRAVSTPTRRAAPEGGASWPRACAFASAAGLGVLAMYLVHPIVSGFELPVGPDGPVYVWWTRYADGAGLDAVPGARPGLPAVALALASFLDTDAVTVVTLLGPVLAATSGLASAALLEAALGPNLVRAAAGAVLTAAFASYLAGGWLGNTALVALFLASGAALVVARRSWAAVAGAGAMLAAGALAHRIVSLFVLAVVAAVVLAHVPEALRDRRRGGRAWDTFAARAAVAVGGGALVATAGLLPALDAQRLPGDTSQDGFFRRHGLRSLLLDRYRERLAGDAFRALVPLATGVGLGVVALARRPATAGERYLVSLMVSWAAVTLAGVAVFAVTGWAPPNRVLVFAFFVPLAAATGLASVWRRARVGVAVVAGAAAVAFVAVSMFGWVRQSPGFTATELATVREAGRAVASLPPGTPLVFPVDTAEPAAAYHVTRALNVIRMGLPSERIPDAHVAVGTTDDVLRGMPTLTGDPEHDAIARAYAEELRGEELGGRPYVVRVEGFGASPPERPALLGEPGESGYVEVGIQRPESVGVSPSALAALSVAALALLAALGGGWAAAIVPGAGARAVLAVAPATGVAVVVLTSVFGERVGLDAGEAPASAATVVLAALGYALPLLRRRGGRSA